MGTVDVKQNLVQFAFFSRAASTRVEWERRIGLSELLMALLETRPVYIESAHVHGFEDDL